MEKPMEHYQLIKQLHVTFVTLSIVFFCVRATWSVQGSTLLQQRWVKIAPHIIDSLLLIFGIWLMVILRLGFDQPWLWAKWIGLVFYIGLGTFAIKRGKTGLIRFGFSLAAVVVFAYIVGCALTKTPMSWVAFI
jgi:uncharacterized membrane protein SirB2